MSEEKKIEDVLCKSCKNGLVIGTISTLGDFKDLFIFCGFFKNAPLKFRGSVVIDCTRYKKIPESEG